MTDRTEHVQDDQDMRARPLKRAVIREELVALTGDIYSALALGQMLYWQERVKDFDAFIAEERVRDPELNMDATHGWIYKTAEELADECMLTRSGETMRRVLQTLVASGWLSRRRNPKYKWDRTYQYRTNLRRIEHDLAELGYHLDGWRLDCIATLLAMDLKSQDMDMNPELVDSNPQEIDAVPEITSEITSEKLTIGNAIALPRATAATSKPAPRHSEKDIARKELEDHFVSLTGLKPPKANTDADRRSAGILWWKPLREILELADGDVASAKGLMGEAVDKLRANRLTIANPKSILKTVQAIRARDAPHQGAYGDSSDVCWYDHITEEIVHPDGRRTPAPGKRKD